MATSEDDLSERESTRGNSTARLSRLLAELASPQTLPELARWDEPLHPGDRLDRFEIRAELGRGGFGTVYEAWDGELGRRVAVKTLRPARARSDASAGSIKQEAEAVAKLNHPGIITLHDVCQSPRGYYLVMERLEGTTLERRLREGPLPWKEAVRLATEIAEALAHAHRRGVLHGDLKPANVFLCEDGRTKLLDFGLAHLLSSGRAGSCGTPGYMAPEQARGEEVDPRADVFALGIVLVEMLTGALPYGTETEKERAGDAGERGVPAGGAPPRLPGAPGRLARLVGRMLARDPAGRPGSGAEVLAELVAFRRSRDAARWRAWIAGTLAVCAVAVAAGMALRPARLPAGRLVVAMADLDNRTGDPNLDGVGELFGAALEQSRRVSLLDRDTLVRHLAQGSARPREIGEAAAVTGARAAAAQLVVVPSLRSVPGGFELAVQVVDALGGRSIFGAGEKAAAYEGLHAATDRLALRVREALAEDVSEAPRAPAPVSAYAPADPEALRLQVEGERLYSAFDPEGARAKWEAAIARDPSFPLPRVALLQASAGTFQFLELDDATTLEHTRALRRDLARLPEAVRPWAETLIVAAEGGYHNFTEYLAALDTAIAARPEQPAPYFMAANLLVHGRSDAEAARPYVDRAVQLAPLAGLGDLVDYLVILGRLDDALVQGRRWVETMPSPAAFQSLSMVHLARGETDEALAAARIVEERWGVVHAGAYVDADRLEELDAALERAPASADYPWFAGRLPALRGRVAEALQALEGGEGPGGADDVTVSAVASARAAVLLLRGDQAAVESALAEAIGAAGGTSQQAWLFAEAGNLDRARALGRRGTDGRTGHRMVRALELWKGGDREATLAQLATIAVSPTWFYRGAILAEVGRHREAVEAFRRYRRQRHVDASTSSAFLFEPAFVPRSLYLEATSLEALGDRDEARQVIRRLLRLWDKADPDLPLLGEAQALDRRLRT